MVFYEKRCDVCNQPICMDMLVGKGYLDGRMFKLCVMDIRPSDNEMNNYPAYLLKCSNI